MLREAIESYELVFWIDADAVIVDAGRDVADDLEAGNELGLVRHRRGERCRTPGSWSCAAATSRAGCSTPPGRPPA